MNVPVHLYVTSCILFSTLDFKNKQRKTLGSFYFQVHFFDDIFPYIYGTAIILSFSSVSFSVRVFVFTY